MKHVPALDGVRGIAVLAVMAHNMNPIGDGHGALTRGVSLVFDLGWVGVQLFFVLSGYLITGILLDSKKSPHYWRSFLGRRVVRIFPIYYAMLIAAFVITPLVWHQIDGSEHQVWLWTYLANWAEPFDRAVPVFPHFWSLSIEEQFYLAWPLIVRALSPRQLLYLCGGLVVAAIVSRTLLRADGFAPSGPYMFTICRVDALAAGAALAVLFRSPVASDAMDRRAAAIRWSALALIAVTIVATRGAPRVGLLTQDVGYTTFALAFTAIVLDVARGGFFARVFDLAPLRACGKYSYAMYLFHMPLHLLIGRRIVGDDLALAPALAYLAVAALATFVAAFLSFHLLEKHFLALKKYFPTGAAA